MEDPSRAVQAPESTTAADQSLIQDILPSVETAETQIARARGAQASETQPWPDITNILEKCASLVALGKKTREGDARGRAELCLETPYGRAWKVFARGQAKEHRRLELILVEFEFCLREHQNNEAEIKALRKRLRDEQRAKRRDMFKQAAIKDYLEEVVTYDFELLQKLLRSLDSGYKSLKTLDELFELLKEMRDISTDAVGKVSA